MPNKSKKATAKQAEKQAEKNQQKAEARKALKETFGEMDPTVRKFLVELIDTTFPSYEYVWKHIPVRGMRI